MMDDLWDLLHHTTPSQENPSAEQTAKHPTRADFSELSRSSKAKIEKLPPPRENSGDVTMTSKYQMVGRIVWKGTVNKN